MREMFLHFEVIFRPSTLDSSEFLVFQKFSIKISKGGMMGRMAKMRAAKEEKRLAAKAAAEMDPSIIKGMTSSLSYKT